MLEKFYFGNCLTNLEHYNGQDTNYYQVYPVDDDLFYDTIAGEVLVADGQKWRIRGQEVALNYCACSWKTMGCRL